MRLTFAVCFCWLLLATGGLSRVVAVARAGPGDKVQTDSIPRVDASRADIRGIVQERKGPYQPLRTTVDALLWAPRETANLLLYSAGYAANTVGNPQFIEQLEDIVYIYERKLGGYPKLSFSSGSTTSFGATIFYRNRPVGGSAGLSYGSSDVWSTKFSLSRGFRTGHAKWLLQFSARARVRDDYRFSGFGADPETDPRNGFTGNATEDFGRYRQYLSRLQFVTGVRLSRSWKLFHTVFFQERKISVPNDPDRENLDEIFDLSLIPGIATDKETKGERFYNEIAARYDTRIHRGRISPGVRVEGYIGLSVGVNDDNSEFSRAGIDAALYLPVIRRTRLIVPRIILDVVDNREDNVPISFVEFPRQPAFRGASSSHLLRSDDISLVPSLEYKWPITYSLGGHIFIDYLLVSRKLSDLSFSEAPYALGFGFDVQKNQSELARVSVSGGSEGFRLGLSFGLSRQTSDRTKWY